MVCGRVGPQRRLLRFTRAADGRVRADPSRRSQGRGAYICAEVGCARQVADGRVFARSFRAPVTIDQQTLDFIQAWQRDESTR